MDWGHHSIGLVSLGAMVFQVLIPDRDPNVGAITRQIFRVMGTPGINLLPEVNFHLRQPTKDPSDEGVGTHEGCSQAVVGGVKSIHFPAELRETSSACLHPADEVPTNFISCSSDFGGKED